MNLFPKIHFSIEITYKQEVRFDPYALFPAFHRERLLANYTFNVLFPTLTMSLLGICQQWLMIILNTSA